MPLLDLGEGQTFLDLCAAPGNKTAQALESGVLGIACDLHWKRLQTVTGCARVALDATKSIPFRSQFDRILVDAPCSGTGTLGRNPEIRWRLLPSDIEELHEKQTRILKNALACLAPGRTTRVFDLLSGKAGERRSSGARVSRNGVSCPRYALSNSRTRCGRRILRKRANGLSRTSRLEFAYSQ